MFSNIRTLFIQPESKESYLAKFNRLKAEIEELKIGLEASEKEGASAEDVAHDAADLAAKLSNLQEIRLAGQSNSAAALTAPTFLAKDVKSAAAAATSEADGSPLVKYELFCKPDKEAVLELSKLNYLEQRLKRIETIIGLNETPKDAAFMNSLLKDQSVMAVVIQLSNKVVQLDHASLERVDARLHGILEKLAAIADKRGSLEALNSSDKLNELYNYYVLTADKRKTLPNVLERLQVLSEVQEQGKSRDLNSSFQIFLTPLFYPSACHFSTTLDSMRDMQAEIQISLEKNGQNLQSLKELLESKSAAVQAIIADFGVRLEKLQKQ